MSKRTPLPPWIKKGMSFDSGYSRTKNILETGGVETICTNARCPNKGECWSRGTATVLILGSICTRNCPFCAVSHGRPLPPDPSEPQRVADMCEKLGITYLVITSVDRDDLDDGGAQQFVDVMEACRKQNPSMRFEILVPDFKGVQEQALQRLDMALPFVFSHNIETVPSLYRKARPGGNYSRSLRLLELASIRWPKTPIKSSIMLGLGEDEQEVEDVLRDLHNAGCSRVAMGQYLQPDKTSLPVEEYITPERFEQWNNQAKAIGFSWVMASPFTRSSYHAEADAERS